MSDFSVRGFVEIGRELRIQPKCSFHSKRPLKTERRVGGHAAPAIDNFAQPRARYSNTFGKIGDRYIEWFEKLLT